MMPDATSRPVAGPIGPGTIDSGDLTARTRIREAALDHFAAQGYERATIRAIAQIAGVSPGLLRHHFGSKAELRAACDEHVLEALRRLSSQLFEDPGAAASTRHVAEPFRPYIARSLADGSPTAGPIFDEMTTVTEQWLARSDAARTDEPVIDRRIRAALITAMALGIPLLHEHVSRALGMDMFTPQGDRLVALGLLDIYSHRVIDDATASSASAGFDEHNP